MNWLRLVLALACVGTVALATGTAARTVTAAAPGSSIQPDDGASRRALLDKYCVTCHNQKLKRGDLTLDTDDAASVGYDAELWERVVRKLRSGLMPPAGMPRPDKGSMDRFIGSLEEALDTAGNAAPNPG